MNWTHGWIRSICLKLQTKSRNWKILSQDYEARKKFAFSRPDMIESDEFSRKEMLDQMSGGTTWEEHVTVYDDFFKSHPEFSRLIKDKDAYDKWRAEEVPY